LRRALGSIGHDAFQMPFRLARDGFETMGFAAQRADRGFHRRALLIEGGFELLAFVLQPGQHVGHGGAVLFLARQHEFGALERGVRNRLDLLGLFVEFDRGGVRCFGGSLGCGAEARRLHVEGLRRHLERAFRRLDGGFHLRGAARHGFGGARRDLGKIFGDRFQALGFLGQSRRDAKLAMVAAGVPNYTSITAVTSLAPPPGLGYYSPRTGVENNYARFTAYLSQVIADMRRSVL